MKKTSLIINVILALAVVVLYVLHFTSQGSFLSEKNNKDSLSFAGPSSGMAYINIDSVYAKYTMYEDVVGDLQKKLNESEAKFQSQQRTFQKNVEDFQYKAQRGLITRSEAEKLQATLAQEEQRLLTLQNQLQYSLSEEQQVAQRKVLNSIMEYLKTMEGAENYQFILGNMFGGNIMYANTNYDITNKVIAGLNEEYAKTKSEEKK